MNTLEAPNIKYLEREFPGQGAAALIDPKYHPRRIPGSTEKPRIGDELENDPRLQAQNLEQWNPVIFIHLKKAVEQCPGKTVEEWQAAITKAITLRNATPGAPSEKVIEVQPLDVINSAKIIEDGGRTRHCRFLNVGSLPLATGGAYQSSSKSTVVEEKEQSQSPAGQKGLDTAIDPGKDEVHDGDYVSSRVCSSPENGSAGSFTVEDSADFAVVQEWRQNEGGPKYLVQKRRRTKHIVDTTIHRYQPHTKPSELPKDRASAASTTSEGFDESVAAEVNALAERHTVFSQQHVRTLHVKETGAWCFKPHALLPRRVAAVYDEHTRIQIMRLTEDVGKMSEMNQAKKLINEEQLFPASSKAVIWHQKLNNAHCFGTYVEK